MKKSLFKRLLAIVCATCMVLGYSIGTMAAPEDGRKAAPTAEEKAVLQKMFDAEFYAEQYPDVVEKLGNNKDKLFEHFCEYGVYEGRQCTPDFDIMTYSMVNPDLQKNFGLDVLSYYTHYDKYGKAEGRYATLDDCAGTGIDTLMVVCQRIMLDAEGRPVFTKFFREGEKEFVFNLEEARIMPEGTFTQYKAPEFKEPEPEPESEPEPEPGPGPACLAAGTPITLADGSRKLVENLSMGDEVRVFNHDTGEFTTAKLFDCFVYAEDMTTAFILHFSNGIDVTVVGGHCFFNKEANTYVSISFDNAEEFIGREFYNADAQRWETLDSVSYIEEPIDAYFVATEYHYNCIANGMLSGEDGIYECLLNIFDYDEDLKIDADKKASEIARYGLYDFENLQYLSKEVYDVLNIKYLSVAIAKGFLTSEDIAAIEAECLENYDELLR